MDRTPADAETRSRCPVRNRDKLMRIGIIGSMQYTEKMLEARDELMKLGHDAFVTNFASSFIGKTDELMQGADAVLVMNLEKHGMKNYIGGNTLMEIGFAHVLDQKIFLYNPIPEIPYYKSEIEAVRPVIINGDLSQVV